MIDYSKRIVVYISIFFLLACASQKKIANAESSPNDIMPHAFPYTEKSAAFVMRDEAHLKSLKTKNEKFKYFLKIALGSEYGLGDFTIKKWTTDIKIQPIGNPTEMDLITLQDVIDDLNAILNHKINIGITDDEGNIQFYFIPQNEFSQFEPTGIVFYGGFFWNWWNYNGEIYKSRIVISSDRISQMHRSHLIREELTQALGLMNDAMDYKDSIFYQGHSEISEYSKIDKMLIKMLYDDNIHAGMSSFEVKDVFTQISAVY